MTNSKDDPNGMSLDNLVKIQVERVNSLKRVLQNFKKDPVSRKSEPYFERRLQQIDGINAAFEGTHHVLVCTEGYSESEYCTKDVVTSFEEKFMEVYCLIAEEQKRMFPDVTSDTHMMNSTAATGGNTATAAEAHVQMPKLPVPKFSGNCVDWPGYHDAFSSLVHSNERLNNIQKFHFLKESLPSGKDNDIRQIPLTDANYQVAWTTLVKRYNNPRLVFSNHMNTLYALPSLTKEKPDDIRFLISTVNVCVAACESIKAPLKGGDEWLAHYLASKMPKETHTAWEHHLGSGSGIPSYQEFEKFLNDRLVTLDTIENRNVSGGIKAASLPADSSKRINVHNTQAQSSPPALRCPHCNADHILRRCQQFLSLDCNQRKEVVTKARICFNCLSSAHKLARCTSNKNCFLCGQRHHTLLHNPAIVPASQAASATTKSATQSMPVMDNTASSSNSNTNPNLQCYSSTASPVARRNILLATARIIVSNPNNGLQATLNALIDQGSEATLISEQAVQSLWLPRRTTRASITGVGQDAGRRCKSTVSCHIQTAVNPEFTLKVDAAYVLNSLTSTLPSQSFSPQKWKHIEGLTLADPHYYRSKRIDLILGADLMAQILLPGTKIGTPDEPIAQNTHFGWMLIGKIESPLNALHIRCHHAMIDTESLLKGFCEVEAVPERSPYSDEELWCESFFKQTHTRQPNGRYIVRLPFKFHFNPNVTLGKSHQLALNRFLQLERRFQRHPDKWNRYREGIEEYFQLDQITPAITSEKSTISTHGSCYHVASCVLPHHAVFKEESLTTKQRIVFDASAKTSNGRSLNDILCVGPPLQNELPAVLLNWRHYRYVFTADVQRMFRCIDVHHDDAQYQRILWRAADGNIKEYCLTTVTFGTTSAPYTAIRVVRQIAEDERHRFPIAEDVLKKEIYVDDILSGDHTIAEAEEKRSQTLSALKSAGMELRKWSSNEPTLLTAIPLEHRSSNACLKLDNTDTIKTLGMHWLPNQDCFTYKMQADIPIGLTKREILSGIARLFDPLGLITPVIISAKIIMKEVTMAKLNLENGSTGSLDWDDPVPSSIAARWQEFRTNLETIDQIRIPRSLKFSPSLSNGMELHTFCDGSSSAYAAAVYLRIKQSDSTFFTSLVVAKSKISPTKPLTIPRTELCGAVLATKLTNWVLTANRWTDARIPVNYWTDASIVLYWIKGDVNRWKTFVANRIAYILDHSDATQWKHISTSENPADCATRGLTPTEISKFSLWWNGPRWLREPHHTWPDSRLPHMEFSETALEAKSLKVHIHATSADVNFIDRFSTYNKLVRITAYVLRFSVNAQTRKQRNTGPLSASELDSALRCVVRMVQAETFDADMKAIRNHKRLPARSALANLTPFIEDEILRIRGRLKHSNLSFDRRHPIILPHRHSFTDLVIQHSHKTTLHGGAQLTLAHIRYTFWIPNGRRAVQRVIRKCVICFRAAPTVGHQLMGDLPIHRVNPPNRPFIATGVDYTGAIEIKAARFRGTSSYKGYIAIFICLATKAIHLEAVTGLSTEHFLQAFARFTGRRGPVQHMYSDNGTNFVGARKALSNVDDIRADQIITDASVAIQGITWHFTPPYSPNFGGIWEANVKSVKHHLKRIVGSHKQTYEELSTVLVRIEACLNSRPLCPLTADSDDLDVLTPAHFLIGDTLLAPPQSWPQKSSLREQFLAQQNLTRQFWTQWSRDWLSHLQTRPKWCQEKENFQLNDLAIIKDDNLPPAQWTLGRVTHLHPGQDSLVRVVTLKTKQGSQKRSVSKLCRLPISG